MAQLTTAERVTRLETEMLAVIKTQEKLQESYDNINGKLDEILALRNKGVGAFWVASSLVGTGIVGLFWQLIEWLK